jgi:hypothetical protein
MFYVYTLYNFTTSQLYNFYTFNTFFEKRLTIRPNWIHFDYILSSIWQYIWLYMYAPDDYQPRPKHAVFNVINWLFCWYTQFNRLLYTTEYTCCVTAQRPLNLHAEQDAWHENNLKTHHSPYAQEQIQFPFCSRFWVLYALSLHNVNRLLLSPSD